MTAILSGFVSSLASDRGDAIVRFLDNRSASGTSLLLTFPAVRHWRAKCHVAGPRPMVDVRLHCHRLRLEEAARPLIELGGLEHNSRQGEALRYTSLRKQPGSHVLRRRPQRAGLRSRALSSQALGFSSISRSLIPYAAFQSGYRRSANHH